MIIDKIIPYGKTRRKLIMDDGFILVLYNSEVLRLGVKDGDELSKDNYDNKIIPTLKTRARERLVHILESSDKPEIELRRKLAESFYPQEAIDFAIEYCKSKHFIDDRRFAENYIRYRSSGKSKRILMQELVAKGIDKDIVSEILEDTDIDESEQIAAELKKRHYSEDMEEKEKQRIYSALARKGYSWEQIRSSVIDMYVN